MSVFRRLAKKLTRITERGDTVVEVLIAIAVVSLILGGAFVTSDRSLQGTRSAEERSNALKMAETQLEAIKYLAASNPTVIFGGTTPPSFCLNGSAAYASSSATCTVDATGAPTTVEPAYHVAVTRSGNTFTVRTTWTRAGSDKQNSVELKYRAYQ